MSTFKYGDRVRCHDGTRPDFKNQSGTVLGTPKVYNNEYTVVQWDNKPLNQTSIPPWEDTPRSWAIPSASLTLLPTITQEPMAMNKQNFVVQIIVALVGVILRRKDVQSHLGKATSLFDGVLKNIEKSLDTLHAEVEQHNSTIHDLKNRVHSERVLADQKLDATQKLIALKGKVSDLVG